ncbi:tannase/feruloyl esterase family alpha/beta hydrolase [Sphingobium sp. H39-3-25]|uniref:tannase/feruloyl esterase family alpha/beta hydrolase n=1 Tax=Sphingobium arseniciresistens TaxID=3030834 RepID=UPI0023B8C394|nr:tannase/feruloyl esterase family alpha/beta hydrolase [Sphingobium arseniciresistens]
MAAGFAAAWGAASQSALAGAAPGEGDFAQRCAALAGLQAAELGKVTSARIGPATFEGRSPVANGPLALPAHCEVLGTFPAHRGTHGQSYAIRYLLRLPQDWNGRFLFQGGGGTNGVIGEAMGWIGAGNTPGLLQGYAVVSQDSGHDNAVNIDPARSGVAVFGTDPVARRDYGHASLPRVAMAAKSLIARFYGSAPRHSYFFGCSKGGQEGMAFAQRYPEMFDGIVAAAPGFSLPRAALAQTWHVQGFARLWNPANGPMTPTSFAALLNDADFALVRDVVGKSCDGLDGLRDGIVNAFAQCTSARILPQLRKRACAPGSGGGMGCIASAKIDALARSLGGPRDGAGKPLYVDWPWDLGVGTPGWSFWKLGSPAMPSLNILTGGASLPSVFMTPPREVRSDPQSLLAFQRAFRFPQDARAIYTTSREFPRSSWQDIAMRSPDLDRFRAHGGKLIVPHGVSDPVFSINDTINWRNEVNARYRGRADDVVRAFPVPGMAHCGGGAATDRFDAFAALVAWVEQGRAPASIAASAGPDAPWPQRQRPLCAYPTFAIYDGSGPVEKKESFRCG